MGKRYPFDVVAYVYEADVHCTECATDRFSDSSLVLGYATDSEGNQVTPVFRDMLESVEACGDCHEFVEA